MAGGARYGEVDGRGVRVGDFEDAGRLGTTRRKESGVGYDTYRSYIRLLGAPPPVMVPDPTADPAVPDPPRIKLINPRTGRLEVDLDAVEKWNRARPGGNVWQFADATPDTLRHSDLREHLLTAARDGDLTTKPPHRAGYQGWTLIRGERQSVRAAQTRIAMQRMGLLTEPLGDERRVERRVELTEVGAQVLTRWGVS